MSSELLARALDVLERVDHDLDSGGPRLSLAPDRDRATGLRDLLLASSAGLSDALQWTYAQSLTQIARAQRRSFPDNLLWDMDYLAASLLADARAASDPIERLRATTDLTVQLEGLFGRRTAIQFRYAHDFLYGFDWARWVAREPEQRAPAGGGGGPFHPTFLSHMLQRGHQILELIAAGDDKYPQLAPGQNRNPFPFSRDPDAELAIHRELARKDMLPVEAWKPDASPRWQAPFRELREREALAMGFRKP